MPILKSQYSPALWFRNGHVSTVWASVFRKTSSPSYQRRQLTLPDGDFIDLDWCYAVEKQAEKLVIISHGLLGNSQRHYVKGTVAAFSMAGYDCLAWNHRGMGGSPNKLETMTTHGSTVELATVVNEAVNKGYEHIILVGWSKGGNITLKYLGEMAQKVPEAVKYAVAISAPIDLQGSVRVMGANSFYAKRFHKKLYKFLQARAHLIPKEKLSEFGTYKLLDDFTENYIAPLCGYKNARAYYSASAALPYLDKIQVPSLIINALDDPILSLTCSPIHIAANSEYIFLETPANGGHCAFPSGLIGGQSWAEQRMLQFVNGTH